MAEHIPNQENWGGLSKSHLADLRPMPLIIVNKRVPPGNFKYGYTEDTQQLVRSQRNSKGVVIADKVGERLLKFNNLEWPIMSNHDYRWLQQQISKFYVYLTYYDARAGQQPNPVNDKADHFTGERTAGGFVTKKFYWGDFSGEPFTFVRNRRNGLLEPETYINVKVNLIDCGEPYLRPGDRNYFDPRDLPLLTVPTSGNFSPGGRWRPEAAVAGGGR